MIRLFISIMTICLAACGLALGADIDGKWTTEMTTRGKDKSKEMTVRTTFNLKADGAKLSGTATMEANGRSRDLPVQDGKIDGNKFSFTTVQKGRDGEMKVLWEGTVEGDELRGERKMEGRPRGMQFIAKKQ